MEQTLVYDPIVRRWACQSRALCCTSHRITVDAVGLSRVSRVLAAAADPRHALVAAIEAPPRGRQVELPRRPGGDCIFLTRDARCDYRTRYGVHTQPTVCRKYPYLAMLTPDRHVVGLSFTCPTALGLLAQQDGVEVHHEAGGEAPTDHLTWLGDPKRTLTGVHGASLSAEEFWGTHWRWLDRYQATPGSATHRLMALVEGEGLGPVDELGVTPTSFAAPDERLLNSLLGRQAPPPGVAQLWVDGAVQAVPNLPALHGSEEDLLVRFIAHRILMPPFYSVRTDLRWLLAVLFAAVVRYRVERDRGHCPLMAIRHTDRLLAHSPWPVRLLGGPSTPPAWRAMATLARATIPSAS